MSVRLVVLLEATPGRGVEFANVFNARCIEMRKDEGCEEYQVYQDVSHPDKFVLLEKWVSQEALDAHWKLQAARTPFPGVQELRLGPGTVESYTFSRIR
ncbi:MAG: antibiotic biosynthesis monooxygenase family protein [Polaromonas sp.]|nr:antibiotic biosynthesis monooxygenase family protein [Polaromonas sp.]